MRKLSLGIPILAILFLSGPSDSPHGSSFKKSCVECHNADDWKVNPKTISFSHATTNFPLTGRHTQVNCRQCHQNLVFAEAKKECASCHADVHEQTTGPDCMRCHNADSWLVPNISNLHRMGRFPLVGAHATADCQQCHKSASILRFDPVGVECIQCHLTKFNQTTNPNHLVSGFSTNCTDCHKINAYEWGGAGFHHEFFPLTLGHQINECARCHTNNNFSNTSPVCVSCHQNTYNNTNQPSHSLTGFSTDCKLCHTTVPGWIPAIFDHSFFPLTGGHNLADCSKCHKNPNYKIVGKNCVDCHQSDYNNTTNPNHAASGFPTDCKSCHNTTTWAGATFNHSTFPLTGGHNIQDCSKCHKNPNYSIVGKNCVDCHQTDYNNTTNPNHTTSGFPTDCKTCHNTTSWAGASFNHDPFFRIYSGKHKNQWNSCSDCHPNSSNYQVFTCITCHTASATNPEHNGVSGYQFNSQSCYNCHKNVK